MKHHFCSFGHTWHEQIPSLNFPELFSFTKNKSLTVPKATPTTLVLFDRLFNLPLSEIAYAQLLSVEGSIQSLAFTREPDHRSYIWESPHFSSTTTRAYRQLTGHAYSL